MRALIQRVTQARVEVEGKTVGACGKGLLIFLGIETEDTETDINWLVKKISGLRIFSDRDNRMNWSLAQTQGEVLVISQFTLHASTKKGNRPSYIRAARPEKAKYLYEFFLKTWKGETGIEPQNGIFGADMQVHLINDGPVTLMMDSKNKE